MHKCPSCANVYIEQETGYYCPGCGDMGWLPLGYKDIFEQVSQKRTERALLEQARQSAIRLDRHSKTVTTDDREATK